jgi:hypothetical protein
MFTALFQPKRSVRRRRRPSRSEPEASYFNRNAPFHTQAFDARSLQVPAIQRPSDGYHDEDEEAVGSDEDESGSDQDMLEEVTPLLPIFSAAHLGQCAYNC